MRGFLKRDPLELGFSLLVTRFDAGKRFRYSGSAEVFLSVDLGQRTVSVGRSHPFATGRARWTVGG